MNDDERAAVKGQVVQLVQLAQPPARRFKRERFDDIEPKSLEWLIKNFLPAEGVGILYGASTVGKSFVALYICVRVARGKPVLGHRTRQSGVLYIAAEGQNGMRKRIKGIREKFSISAPLFQFIGDGLNLLKEEDVEGIIAEAEEAKAEMMAEAGASLGLVVIDTTAAAMAGGNENAGEDMSRVLEAGMKIGQRAGAMVLFIAHPGKNEALGVRGWSGQTGNVDAIIHLSKSEDEPDLRLGVVQKLKDGEDGERFAYRLRRLSIGIDADGDEITTAYPEFEEAPRAVPPRRRQRADEKPGPALILRAMRLMIDEGQGELVPAVQGVPAQTFGVQRLALRERVVRLGYADPEDKPESVKRNINRDIQALAAVSAIRVEGDLIWPTRKS